MGVLSTPFSFKLAYSECPPHPKKVSHCQEPLLNCIKITTEARFFISFDYKMSTRILYVCIKYSMYDNLICGIISSVFEAVIPVNQCIR